MTKEHFHGFFDRYTRFEETSTVASNLSRLNFRAHMIISRNRHLIEGRTVLDLACHDARFTTAALLEGGAKKVVGIEAREHVAAAGRENLAHYGIGQDRAKIITGDIFTEMAKLEPGIFDTVLCLGFLYHTARQFEVASLISRLGATAVIIDSTVLPATQKPVVRLHWEDTDADSKIWDASRSKVLSAVPSAAAISCYFQEFGYNVTLIEPDVPIPPTARQYANKRRATMVAVKEG